MVSSSDQPRALDPFLLASASIVQSFRRILSAPTSADHGTQEVSAQGQSSNYWKLGVDDRRKSASNNAIKVHSRFAVGEGQHVRQRQGPQGPQPSTFEYVL